MSFNNFDDGETGTRRRRLVRLAEQVRSTIFPLRICPCLPASVAAFLPQTVQEVHDVTHFVLVLGTFGSASMLLTTALAVWSGSFCGTPFCLRTIVSVIFTVPCLLYFVRIIQRYDQNLLKKTLEVQQMQDELKRSYEDTIQEMDGLLAKALESSSTLAERNFESKRRDFLRFLDRIKGRHMELFAGVEVNSKEFLEQFNRFVLCWLHIFQECSIDPVNRPKVVVTSAELARCTSAAQTAELVLERLKATEVCFISKQRARDQEMIKTMNLQKKSSVQVMFGRTATSTQMKCILQAWRAYALKKKEKRVQGRWGLSRSGPSEPQEDEPGLSFHHDVELGSPDDAVRKRCGCSWVRLGPAATEGELGGKDAAGFPRVLSCGIASITLLSATHVNLIGAFFAGWACIFLTFLGSRINLVSLIDVGCVELCLVMLLLRFEELDDVQRLAAEVRKLELETKLAQDRKDEMTRFWQQCQMLTDLWLYRTVSRLELIKELHGYLEDVDGPVMVATLLKINDALDDLEKGLGPLEMWRADGLLGEDHKKDFAKSVSSLCQQQDLSAILGNMKQLRDRSQDRVRKSLAITAAP